MGVISVRLNKREEEIVKKLAEYFHEDKSTLIKKSLFELYESVADLRAIREFEEKEKKEKVSFSTADDIVK